MKKLLVILLAFGSIFSFATSIGIESDFCQDKESLIKQIEESNKKAKYLQNYTDNCELMNDNYDVCYLHGYSLTAGKVERKVQEGFALANAIRMYCKD